MKKFILKIAIIGAYMLVILYGLDALFTSTFKKGDTVKVQWLNRMNEQHYDYGIIGSSRAWWNIDVNKMNSTVDQRGINLSNNHFRDSEIYLRLKRFYERGNTLEKLFLQVDYDFFREQDFSSTITNYLPFIDDSTTYSSIVKHDKKWILYKYAPFWRYAEYNFQWGPEEFMVTKMGLRNSIFDSTGCFFSNNQFKGRDSTEFYHQLKRSNYLDQIQTFCGEHNIKLELFTSPYLNLTVNERMNERFHKLINQYSVPYYNHSDLYGEKVFFNNNDHLSLYGGAQYTKVLIQYFF